MIQMVRKLHEEMGLERAVARAFDLNYAAKLDLEGQERFERLTKENGLCRLRVD